MKPPETMSEAYICGVKDTCRVMRQSAMMKMPVDWVKQYIKVIDEAERGLLEWPMQVQRMVKAMQPPKASDE